MSAPLFPALSGFALFTPVLVVGFASCTPPHFVTDASQIVTEAGARGRKTVTISDEVTISKRPAFSLRSVSAENSSLSSLIVTVRRPWKTRLSDDSDDSDDGRPCVVRMRAHNA
jgi:hypothetical protein